MNISNKDALSIHKILLCSAINKSNEELQHVSKEFSQPETFLFQQLSTTDFYILNRCITSHNKKSLQKLLNTQHKNYLHLRETAAYIHSHLMKQLLNSHNMNFPRNNPIYLKQVYIFLSNQKKFENLKSSLPSKRFLVHLSKETKSQIKVHLSYLANSYFYNYKPSPRIPRQHRVLWNLRKNKDIVITKPDKENGVVILGQKLYDNVIQEIISDTSTFEKLKKDPTLKREASLQRFYVSWNKKTFFNESMVPLKYSSFRLVIYFLNFARLFHL